MFLNSIASANGARKKSKRVGRGIGCTDGKTCGRGHKGQKARAGGYHKVGFEGGQMPLQRRLPKVGFNSAMAKFSAEVRLSELEGLHVEVIDIDVLKKYSVIAAAVSKVKVIKSGNLSRPVYIKGLQVTPGAKEVIEAVGGKIEA
ncbi:MULTISPECIES: 50S ribosomal protein L15 [Methylomonas]|uniref:50S ribosomal protein L15 n=1 Tax=Methylomonas TaxID=416 RepID=UPI001231B0D4|nr:50S ribosomal protein L15 [Methylomonas rhizoryzae]